MVEERFGTKRIQRAVSKKEEAERRQEEFLAGLEERQFRRAIERMEEGRESVEDIVYAARKASKFFVEFTQDEFEEKLARIREGRHSNLDVLEVSTHYKLQGNEEGCSTIRRFYTEERRSVENVVLPVSPTPDAIDIANGLVDLPEGF
jgi:hypothetical protein